MSDQPANPSTEPVFPRPWADLANPVTEDLVDDGPELLDTLRARFQMDDEWIDRSDRTLTWWGAPNPLRFFVSQPRLSFGDPVIKVTATTRLVEHPSDPEEGRLGVLGALNGLVAGGFYWWDSESDAVCSTVTHYAHAGNPTVTDRFGEIALIAYAEALGKGPYLADLFQGGAAKAPHPETGWREDVDSLIGYQDNIVLPTGTQPNRWIAEDVSAAADYLRELGMFSTNGGGDLSCEFPFSGSIPWAFAAARGLSPEGRTSLLQIKTNEPHPGYGNGLMSLLRLPETGETEDRLLLANGLNRAEATDLTGFPAWGGWCAMPDDHYLAHVAFYPSVERRPGFATTIASYEFLRSQWVQERLVDPALVESIRAGER